MPPACDASPEPAGRHPKIASTGSGSRCETSGVPDRTYIPLSPIASAVLGERRTQITAMRLLAGLIDHFGGRRWIPWVFGHPPIPPQLMGRFGASAQLSICKSLLAFMAHDRAGFGGALIGAGLAVLLISSWGWRRGQRWVWWSLLAGCAFGTAPHPDNSPSHRLHPPRAPAAGVCPHRGHRGRTHSVPAIPHRSCGTHRSA